MRDWYDTPQITDLLEEQARLLPEGSSGYICPKFEIAEGLPEEGISLVTHYWEGKVAEMEFANARKSKIAASVEADQIAGTIAPRVYTGIYGHQNAFI